jgi:hypothetical protein
MEIEIITTKKKITKSLVNQMRHDPPKLVLEQGKPLGFIIAIVKNCYKAILLSHEGQYYIIPANYKKGDKSVYRRIGNRTHSIKFESESLCDAWWEAYQTIKEKSVDQIYL